MSAREIQPKEETHVWVVELARFGRRSWFLSYRSEQGHGVFTTREAAHAFKRELRACRRKDGTHEFKHVRVRRAVVRAWGCAV